MEKRFPTLEEAEFYAADLRRQGYMASVCDEGAATLWGPPTTRGFRVLVSETTGEHREEVPPPGRVELLVGGIVRFTVIGVLVAGAIWFALEFTAFLVHGGFLPAVSAVLAAGLLVYSLGAWSLLLAAAFRKQREPGSRAGLLVHALVSAVAALLVLVMLLLA